MYIVLLKKRILACLAAAAVLLLLSGAAYGYFSLQVQQGEAGHGFRSAALLAGGFAAALCAAAGAAYVFGYRWWGIDRARWQSGRARTAADAPMNDFSRRPAGFSSRSFAAVFLLAVFIGGAAAYGLKTRPPSAFKCIAQRDLAGLDAVAAARPAVLNERRSCGATLLISAVDLQEEEIAAYLIARGADVNAADRSGKTVLMHAAGSPRLVEMLLRAGAAPTAADRAGTTALDLALQQQCKRSCSLLLERGARTAARPGGQRAALFSAINSGFDVYDLLLSHGADPDAADEAGETPLHWAARAGSAAAVEALIRAGSSPAALSHQGWTPLHTAVLHGSRDAAAELLKAGVPVDIQNARQQTPLSCAVYDGNADFADFLLQQGADVNAVDAAGNSALHQALLRKDLLLTELLISRGADLDLANNAGITPRKLIDKQALLSGGTSVAAAGKGAW